MSTFNFFNFEIVPNQNSIKRILNFIFLLKVLKNEYNHVSVPMEIVQMNGHTIGSRLQSVNKLSMS